MAILGEEVADAYISVHADTTAFRRDMRKLQASSNKLFDETGKTAARTFQKAWIKQIREFPAAMGRRLRGVATQVGNSVTAAFRTVRSNFNTLIRTLSTDLRIIGAVIDDQVVHPIRRGLTRAFNQVIVSVGEAKDAVADFGRDIGSVLQGQLANQLLRIRVGIERIGPALRGLKNSFLDTAVGAREMLAPGVWARFEETLRLAALHTRVLGGRAAEEFRDGFRRVWNSDLMNSARQGVRDLGDVIRDAAFNMRIAGALVVEQFRRGFDRAWNSDLMAATRVWVRDLVTAMRSGMTALGSVFELGLAKARVQVSAGTERISAAFSTMWDRIRTRSKKGADDHNDAVREVVDETEQMAKGVGRATRKMADGIDRDMRSGARSTSMFLGHLKGSRNDFLNIVGVIGGAVERLASRAVIGGLELAGGAVTKLGEALIGLGGKNGNGGPLAGVGETIANVGGSIAGMAGKGGWIGAAVGIAALSAAMHLFIPILALVTTGLSALLGIAVALASSLAFGLAGFLLPLGPMAFAAAAGVGALVVAFSDLSEKQKKAFDPLKNTFKDIRKTVQERLFANLADQIKGLNDILNESVAPLLIGAATALSGVIDYMIMAFDRESVKQSITMLSETLPGILTDLGTGFTDMVTGITGFFSAIAPDVSAVVQGIADIAWQFSQWANSTEGQLTIKQFFADARESAGILWGLVLNVGDALGTLFGQGKETGDQFLQKISDIIAEFAEWADSEEGRKQISDWLTFAKDVAGLLWAAIEKVGEVLAALDNPTNRAFLIVFLSMVNNILGALSTVAQFLEDIPRLIGLIVHGKALEIPGLKKVSDAASALWDTLAKILGFQGNPNIRPSKGGGGSSNQVMKAGGLVTSPRVFAGEAGRELVVPLVRPLNQVDPSVRAVSAFARGLDTSGFNGGNPGGKVVNIHSGAVQVTAATDNEGQVANAVLDRLVARWK